MADPFGVPPITGTKLEQLRAKANIPRWQLRLADIEIRYEEMAMETARLKEEEKGLRENLAKAGVVM